MYGISTCSNQTSTRPVWIKLICAIIICSSSRQVLSDSHLSDKAKIVFQTIGRLFLRPLKAPCYLIDLFIMVHNIWIELNWNWKKMNWIGIELKDSESDLNLNWIEKFWIQHELELNWIELKEMNWTEPCLAYMIYIENI